MGTWLTASAHIITAVIGSGVLSLAWAVAQLGWIAGPTVIVMFALITWFASMLLAGCNKSPDPITGKRNYTYMDLVKANLGGVEVKLCGLAQYAYLIGASIGYTITSGINAVAVIRTNCFRKYGPNADCQRSGSLPLIIFGCIQLILSQTPNFHNLSFLSVIAAIMSFSYAFIGVALSIAKIASQYGEGGNHVRTSLSGVTVGVDVTSEEKIWRVFQALGNIAFAFGFSMVLVEIQANQLLARHYYLLALPGFPKGMGIGGGDRVYPRVNDTLKSGTSKKKAMQKATTVSIFVTTVFYVLCGTTGYAAFGNDAPGNLLTGFELDKLFWLVDFANVCVVVHLIGAYQVYSQPFFQFVEKKCADKWPESGLIKATYSIHIPMFGNCDVNFFQLVWRSIYVIVTTVVAVILPFFNDFLGLIGAIAFWPLTVFLPTQMHIKQTRIRTFSITWICFQILSLICLLITLLAFAASIQGIVVSFKAHNPVAS
ncbi:Amino acid transporter, transmembrane domain, partial [Dillenia turbinata]